MNTMQELQSKVLTLQPKDFAKFRDWFMEIENELWDQQISNDYKAGKFNKLIAKARMEMAQGKAKKL